MPVLHSVEATLNWGQELGRTLEADAVIALCGPLGAGKTHLCKGIVQGLGSNEEVTSPTFGLVHEYRGGHLPVFHFDFYRIDEPTELLRLGWDDYLDERGVMLVEWADRFPQLMPEQTQWLNLQLLADGGRELNLNSSPPA